MAKKFCDHICTSNCRREGCNCDCGEYHNEDGIYEDDEEEEVDEAYELNKRESQIALSQYPLNQNND